MVSLLYKVEMQSGLRVVLEEMAESNGIIIQRCGIEL
jgi:hypothetical protein